MRPIDRIEVISAIGGELHDRMSYSDIDAYMTSHGVNTDKLSSYGNNKGEYVKHLLYDETDETLVEILEELDLHFDNLIDARSDKVPPGFWAPGEFRLFLSHVSAFKETASQLQQVLKSFGITAFVAHEDIEPTKEWQLEIERALFSMDALAAILTPEFPESKWTDQEVGAAMGREVLVIPIRRELDPYGFMGKFQGLQGLGKKVGEVAETLFDIISSHAETRNRMGEVLVDKLLVANTDNLADKWLELIEGVENFPAPQVEKLRNNLRDINPFSALGALNNRTEALLEKYGLEMPELKLPETVSTDDEVPF